MVLTLSFCAARPAYGQLVDDHLRDGTEWRELLSLSRFLAAVAASNLELAAQRFNISIAQAQLVAARVSPNPTLSFGNNSDISNKQQPQSENVGISQTIEIGGKRHFRTSVATKNLLAASATLEDFFRTLRGTAASAYVDAVAGELIVAQKRKGFESLNKLADLNRLRFQQGDAAEVDYNQALVDSLQAQGELTTAAATARNAQIALLQFLARPDSSVPRISGTLHIPPRSFALTALLQRTLNTRPDVVAARNTYDSTRSAVALARANRLPDLTASAAVQQTGAGRNPINPSPSFNSLNVGVSLPLPLFNSYRGEYLAAQRTSLQAETTLRSTESKAQIEVRQAFERYRLAKQRAAQYEGSILELAAKVVDARLAAYKSGGATLLDVLTAQKADTDVRLAAIDAQSERAKALIALEQAANFWDIEL